MRLLLFALGLLAMVAGGLKFRERIRTRIGTTPFSIGELVLGFAACAASVAIPGPSGLHTVIAGLAVLAMVFAGIHQSRLTAAFSRRRDLSESHRLKQFMDADALSSHPTPTPPTSPLPPEMAAPADKTATPGTRTPKAPTAPKASIAPKAPIAPEASKAPEPPSPSNPAGSGARPAPTTPTPSIAERVLGRQAATRPSVPPSGSPRPSPPSERRPVGPPKPSEGTPTDEA